MSKIRDQVKAFHDKFGIEDPDVPTIPSAEKLRLRLAMLAEEYEELTVALGLKSLVLSEHRAEIWSWTPEPEKFDMVEVADALADIDYLSEGFRLTCGIKGDTISNEVQRSNMEKIIDPENPKGKIRKPKSWEPPNIRQCLIEQGWIPPENNQEKEVA